MNTVYTLENLSKIRDDFPDASLYGVLGYPVAHSLSPQMHQAAFDHLGIAARYVPIEIKGEELPQALPLLKKLGFQGWNCTLPHKIKILSQLDQIDEHATLLGAVNTVIHDRGKLIGFNTDGPGWVRAIRHDFSVDVRDLRILILGAGGGAGQALATQAAIEQCARLILINRTYEKAQELSKKLEPYFQSEKLMGAHPRLQALPWNEKVITQELENIDLLVNCTPVGLKPYEPSVLPEWTLQPHLMIYDTIYSPPLTKLLQAAQHIGARYANGLSMLLHQGALAFELWTGRPAPLSIMQQALLKSSS